MADTVLELQNVSQRYDDVQVLNNVSLGLNRAEVMALTGPSGSGKTTLLQIAGLLSSPSKGEVIVNGDVVSDASRNTLRRDQLGFVFQFHHLLAELNMLENVLMPLKIARREDANGIARAKDLLQRVGLSHRLTHRPSELSGGERQRAALVRALVHRPQILLADEPTGNLDAEKSRDIWALLQELASEQQCAILLATHNEELAASAARQISLRDGSLEVIR